jgi:hypothetical protein
MNQLLPSMETDRTFCDVETHWTSKYYSGELQDLKTKIRPYTEQHMPGYF